MKKLITVLLLIGAGAFANAAQAIIIQSQVIYLDQVYTGNIPDGSSPWLKAQFDYLPGGTTGTLTLTSLLGGSDFLQGLSSSKATVGWAFYLNPLMTGITCDTVSSTNCATTVLFGGSYNTGPVPGGFNLAFGWDSGGRFMPGDTAIYDLTFASGLAGGPIALNASDWESVAHVQGIGPLANCSGWIVAGTGTGADGGTPCVGTPPPSVPEPAAASLFVLGLLGIGLLVGLGTRRIS